ncbi:cardiolipin synthase (CMP-forming) [Aplochiton taeniatus]
MADNMLEGNTHECEQEVAGTTGTTSPPGPAGTTEFATQIGEAREFGIIPGRPVPTAEWVHLKVIKRKWSEPRWTGPWKVRERTEHAIHLEGKGEAWLITATIEKPGPPPAYQMPLLGTPDQDSYEWDQDLEDDDVSISQGRSRALCITRLLWSHQALQSRGLCCQKPSQPPKPNTTPVEEQGDGDTAVPGQGLFKFKELYENPWTVPNLLCVCRIVLAPFLGHLIMEQHFHLSLALFTLAGATDLLDGYIARTWPNQKSALGSALDPLADKILISVLYVSLTAAQLIPAPLTVLIISRDVGLIAAVFWVRYKTVPPPVTLSKFFNPCYTTAQLKPTLVSKVNTAVQLFLVAASLAAPVFHYTDSLLLQALWYITAVTTAASGYSYYHYGKKTVEVLKTR